MTEFTTEELSLEQRVERSHEEMERLEGELRSVEHELAALAQRNHQYDVLTRVCDSLEELDSLDAADLFWPASDDGHDSAESIRQARKKISDFNDEIARVEEHHAQLVDKIGDKNHILDQLHYELLDAFEQEEQRKGEWLVEREEVELPNRPAVMPWARGYDEDQRFRKSLAMSMVICLALSMLVGTIALPIVERPKLIEVPERVAKLVRKETPRPPEPEPVAEIPVPDEEIPEPEPEPELAEELPPEELPKSIDTAVAEQQPAPKEQVKTKGILAFRDSFANRAQIRPAAQLGAQASFNNAGDKATGRTERSMVTTSAPGSSGGINLASISRNVGGGGEGMAGVAVSKVASSIGGGEGVARPMSGGAAAGRTDEEIQIVFDRYKAALYRLYNKELRRDPTLRGQMILRLTIEPDGSVSMCELQSSDMNAPELADQVVGRVHTFDFGAKEDIVAMTIIYPIDFLPAA